MKIPLCELKEYNITFVNRKTTQNGCIAILINKNLAIHLDWISRFVRKEFFNHVLRIGLLDQSIQFLDIMGKLS